MSIPNLAVRFIGMALIVASFFMRNIMMLFPGLPLQLGGIAFKHYIFAVGVILYLLAAWQSKASWKRGRLTDQEEE